MLQLQEKAINSAVNADSNWDGSVINAEPPLNPDISFAASAERL